jgi:uncharacterized membrane protein
MLARVKTLWENVRYSLWALPLAIAVACGLLAMIVLGADIPWVSEVGWLYAGGSQQAPEFAASLVGAMITLTALAFSITMVVLTLAAQQLGPRLIEIFMRDRGTQAALGLFIGTVVYLLLVLRALDGGETSRSPALAITGGTGLVLFSVVSLLFFVHSLARTIVSDSIVARVGEALDHAICEAFPRKTPSANSHVPPPRGAAVRLAPRGYVQRIDYDGLARAVEQHNAVVQLAYGVGRHVVHGEIDAWVTTTEDLASEIGNCVVIGSRHSSTQDPEWSQRQLVEIALRALSSGVNDVFTALAVIDRLSLSLSILIERGEAQRVWCDEKGAPRIFGPAPDFASMLAGAFNQIRESGAQQGAVLRRLAENLSKLASLARAEHAGPIETQLSLLEASVTRLEDAAESGSIDLAIRCGRAALRETVA